MRLIEDYRYARAVFWRKNSPIILFLIVIFISGVFFGSVASHTLDFLTKQELASYLIAFLDGFDEELSLRGQSGFFPILLHQGSFALLLWILGFSIVGLPFIPIFIFLRGFVLGFTLGFLLEEIGMHGFWFGLAALLPQNLVLIPLYFISGLIAIAFSFSLLRSLLQRRAFDFWNQFLGYSFLMGGCALLFVLAGLVEFFVSPIFMDWAARNFLFG